MSNTNPVIDIIAELPIAIVNYLRANFNVYTYVQGRVYLDTENADLYPVILVEYISGGEINDSSRHDVNVVYRISALALEQATALTIAAVIQIALHDKQIPLPFEWTNYYTRGYNWFYKPLTRLAQKTYRAGRLYEIRANETSLIQVAKL